MIRYDRIPASRSVSAGAQSRERTSKLKLAYWQFYFAALPAVHSVGSTHCCRHRLPQSGKNNQQPTTTTATATSAARPPTTYPLGAKVGPVLEIEPLDVVLHPFNHATPVVRRRSLSRLLFRGGDIPPPNFPPPAEIGRVLHVPREKRGLSRNARFKVQGVQCSNQKIYCTYSSASHLVNL